MPIITRQRSERFAIIPNAVADDDRLSYEARGMLCYLLAKPNNWRVSVRNLQRAGNIGRDKTYRILNELIAAGYVTRSQEKAEAGKFGEQEYVVYDDPVPDQLPFPENPEAVLPLPEKPDAAGPCPETPYTDQPDTENPDALIRTHPTNTESTKNPFPNAGFADLWMAWPQEHRPQNRTLAETHFLNLPAPADRQQALEHAGAYRRLLAYRGEKPTLIPYLKERRWREIAGAPPYDKDGDFVITPDREEWRPWLDAIRAEHGETGAKSALRLGKIVRRDRWPPAGALAKGHQLTMQMEAAHG